MSSQNGHITVPVFWSMRSPYCYISLDRCLEYQRRYNLTLELVPIWPIAIKDPHAFDVMKEMHYRLPYQNVDLFRAAAFHGVQLLYPNPDPVNQLPAPDSPYGKIAAFEDQKDIQFLTYTAVGAAEMGKGWDYMNMVMRTVWNGETVPWNRDDYKYIKQAIQLAGIDADALVKDVQTNPTKYKDLVDRNTERQKDNTCEHTGVPLFVFKGEPFFGQDRMDMLIWRLAQYGLTERADYQPSLRAQAEHFGSD
jgi:2-hydroxychromene-2-carboxylate isomerase